MLRKIFWQIRLWDRLRPRGMLYKVELAFAIWMQLYQLQGEKASAAREEPNTEFANPLRWQQSLGLSQSLSGPGLTVYRSVEISITYGMIPVGRGPNPQS